MATGQIPNIRVRSTVEVSGQLAPKFQRMFDSAQPQWDEEGERILQKIKERLPYRTGALRESYRVKRVAPGRKGIVRVMIVSDSPYAAAHERGSGLYASPVPGFMGSTQAKYPIRPIPPKTMLMWYKTGEGGPMRVLRPMVMHPGVHATWVVRDVIKEETTNIWTRVRTITEVLKE